MQIISKETEIFGRAAKDSYITCVFIFHAFASREFVQEDIRYRVTVENFGRKYRNTVNKGRTSSTKESLIPLRTMSKIQEMKQRNIYVKRLFFFLKSVVPDRNRQKLRYRKSTNTHYYSNKALFKQRQKYL